MKIMEAITRLDSLKFNTYTQADKVEWLSRLDSMVKKHKIIESYEVFLYCDECGTNQQIGKRTEHLLQYRNNRCGKTAEL